MYNRSCMFVWFSVMYSPTYIIPRTFYIFWSFSLYFLFGWIFLVFLVEKQKKHENKHKYINFYTPSNSKDYVRFVREFSQFSYAVNQSIGRIRKSYCIANIHSNSINLYSVKQIVCEVLLGKVNSI